MSYVALYRKFRPHVFSDVVGQEHIVTTLQNQIKSSRLGHAYLFTGTRGTGKTTIAKIMGRAVNCENPVEGNPCGECKMCKAIAAGTSLNVIEIDAASNNGVDNVRQIIDEVEYRPTEGKYKVYIIDEVHMLSTGAFNALLKTLEEPPEYVIFILATTEVHKIPITILSRCQRYDFRRIDIPTISDRIRTLVSVEKVEIDDDAIEYIAKAADGSMRDSLSLLDQCIAFNYGERLTYDLVLSCLGAVDTLVFARLLDAVLQRNILQAIQLLDEVVHNGRDLMQFVTEFTWYLRNLMIVKTADVTESALEVSKDTIARLREAANKIELSTIIFYIGIFSKLASDIKYSSQKRIMIEVAIIKLCTPQMDSSDDGFKQRVRELERRIDNNEVVVYAQPGMADNVKREKIEQPKLPAALPDEIKQIAARWDHFVDGIENRSVKSYFKGAIPSVNDEGVLLIVLEDSVAYDWVSSPEHKDEIEKYACDYLNKTIKIEFRKVSEGHFAQDEYVDISKALGINVSIEQ